MKLLYCPSCGDIFNLAVNKDKYCSCGEVHGYYTDILNAVYFGPAIPLGIANKSFTYALQFQRDRAPGTPFDAFVIEKNCPTFIKER